MKKKILSVLLVLTMIFTAVPFTANANDENVYISISYDGEYIDGVDGKVAYSAARDK